ncbi:hypothetical protein PK98_04440 [Croceibacterium mercuriale]|uniref:DUF1266 domain-containing protein n=1 Tax=Croceibacterium mercuriale TaxID=1572751 RepID=A0A0B2C111_9SPHN|nr:DUF1266 domain-containing protein [Croceibacterium mercuriale]KHL25855.1 hypothetical protein PK98_04440 [Croceibacterium mercuriale]
MTVAPAIILSDHPIADETRAWAYALGAMYHVAQGFHADAPTGEPEDGLNAHILADSWGATNRAELVGRMTDLGNDGHRKDHVRLVRYYCMLWRPAVAARREEYRSALREGGEAAEDARTALWRLDAVQANVGDIRSSSLLAFDAARGIMLARAGLMLGWLSEDEAWAYMLDVGRDVQRTYPSWSEYAADFVLARNMWAGDGSTDIFDSVIAGLRTDAASPWVRLAWSRPELTTPRAVRQFDGDTPYWTLEQDGG